MAPRLRVLPLCVPDPGANYDLPKQAVRSNQDRPRKRQSLANDDTWRIARRRKPTVDCRRPRSAASGTKPNMRSRGNLTRTGMVNQTRAGDGTPSGSVFHCRQSTRVKAPLAGFRRDGSLLRCGTARFALGCSPFRTLRGRAFGRSASAGKTFKGWFKVASGDPSRVTLSTRGSNTGLWSNSARGECGFAAGCHVPFSVIETHRSRPRRAERVKLASPIRAPKTAFRRGAMATSLP